MASPEANIDRSFGEKVGFTAEAFGAVTLVGAVAVPVPALIAPSLLLIVGGEGIKRLSR